MKILTSKFFQENKISIISYQNRSQFHALDKTWPYRINQVFFYPKTNQNRLRMLFAFLKSIDIGVCSISSLLAEAITRDNQLDISRLLRPCSTWAWSSSNKTLKGLNFNLNGRKATSLDHLIIMETEHAPRVDIVPNPFILLYIKFI